MQSFTRTISQPANARTDANSDHVLLAWDPKIGIKQYKVQISSTPDFSQTVESVTTDNTSYAPTMTQFGYNAGGTLYWRVAGVDEDRNQGDWAPAQVIRLLPRLKLSVIGVVKRGHMSRIRATVLDGHSKRLYRVVVRVSGGGVKARNVKTNRMGVATFKLKPRKRGTLTFRATKSGFQAAYATLKIK